MKAVSCSLRPWWQSRRINFFSFRFNFSSLSFQTRDMATNLQNLSNISPNGDTTNTGSRPGSELQPLAKQLRHRLLPFNNQDQYIQISMIFLSLLISSVLADTCKVINPNPTVYPVSGQPYALQLLNYFAGTNLVFSTNPPTNFQITQQLTTSNYTFSTPLPSGSQILQIARNENPIKSLAQNNIAALVLRKGNYYVYLAQEVVSTATIQGWTLASLPIQGFNIVCNALTFVFGFSENQNIVVSCIYNGNQQIFYVIDPNETDNMFPLLEQTGIILPSLDSKLVAFQSAYVSNTTTLLSVSYSNINQSVAYIIEVSEVEGLATKFVVKSNVNINTPMYGFQLIDETAYIILQSTQITVSNNGINQVVALPTGSLALTMGALVLDYYVDSYQVLINIAYGNYTQNYLLLVDLGIINSFGAVAPQISYPEGFDTTINSIQVSPAYVLISSTTQMLLIPGYLQPNINYPIWFWQLDSSNPVVSIINSYTQTIYQIGPSLQNNILLSQPFILIANSQAGQGSFQIIASNQGGVCPTMLTYQVTASNQVVSIGQIPNSEVSQSQGLPIILNQYFLGANLIYGATYTNSSGGIQNISLFQVQQTAPPINVAETILFSQLVPFNLMDTSGPYPRESYFYFLQTAANPTMLQVWFCGQEACSDGNKSKAQKLVIKGTIQQIALSQIANTNKNYLAISYQNSPNVTVYQMLGNKQISPQTAVLITLSANIPNATVSQIAISSNILFILTSSPSVLFMYSLYNLQYPQSYPLQNSLSPRQIFTSPYYPELLFVDNVDALIVLTVQGWDSDTQVGLAQQINYHITQGQSYVGVGLLESGFYVAETNSTSQFLTFYPKVSLDAFYPYSQDKIGVAVNLASLGLTITTPLISAFSELNFYLQVSLNNQNQIAIFQGPKQPLSMFYKAFPIPSVTSISLAPVLYHQNPAYAYDLLNINFGSLFLQASVNVVSYFDPSNTLESQTYSLVFTATSPTGTSQLSTKVTVFISSLDIQPQLYYDSEIAAPSKPFPGVFYINPAHFFYGMIKEYNVTITNSNGALSTQPSYVIQPIYNVPKVQNSQIQNYTSTTSNSTYQLLYVNQTGMYQIQQVNVTKNYLLSTILFDSTSKYQLTNTIGCPLSFYYNITMPVVLCQNNTQAALFYVFGFQYLEFANGSIVGDVTSAQYNQKYQLLAFTTPGFLQFYPIIFNQTSNQFELNLPTFSLPNAQLIANYSIVTALNLDKGLIFYGVVTVLLDGSTVNLYGYLNSTQTVNHTIQISPSSGTANQNDNTSILSIQQFGSAYVVNNLTETQIHMQIVVLTRKQAYLFSLKFEAIPKSQNVVAVQMATFSSFDSLPTQALLVSNSQIVTTYFNSTDQTTILGLYQPPLNYSITKTVGFYAFQTFPFPITSLQLSTNGTLTFQDPSENLYQFQLFSYVSVYFDLTLINQNLASVNNQQMVLSLTATNTKKNATQNFTGLFFINTQGEPTIKPRFEAKMITGGIFGIVIIASLSFLFYKSCKRSQFNEEND